jgi:hypothetical protein
MQGASNELEINKQELLEPEKNVPLRRLFPPLSVVNSNLSKGIKKRSKVQDTLQNYIFEGHLKL